MCDCYTHKCNYNDCKEMILIHLGDFNTLRNEIEVYCDKHIPDYLKNGVLWEQCNNGNKIFINALTQNARARWNDNYPNIYHDTKPINIFGRKILFTEKYNFVMDYLNE